MIKLSNALKIIGKIWIVLVIAYITLSISLFMLIGSTTLEDLILSFVNFWNFLLIILLLLPGYLCVIMSEKLAQKYISNAIDISEYSAISTDTNGGNKAIGEDN